MPKSPQDDPDAVTIAETGVGHFQVEVTAPGATFLADEPERAGGLGSGPNPYDLLAAALGACTTMTMRLYAERKGWPLERATVRVVHARDGLKGRDRFAREIVLKGPLTDTQTRRLIEIAEKCPVHRTLETGSDIITVLAAQPTSDLALAGEAHLRDMLEACAE
ncbi:MAG: OsmC family peroxiredoxin [Phenylobacterium sp.]|uniref:OsmC family protein n=1 Tax=Phenylobacterium sp. TaxID=1871053 RepID=UPI0012076EED|nr:OsmC family protein [Phenylobacterium sp.]TAL30804.1 MAG: OsmC family peroxiredoxin [Phenylobacterium sp.]